MDNNFIIGIDLGTTNSCVAVVADKKVHVIPSESGSNTMPSLVAFEEVRLVGEGAKDQMQSNFKNTIYNIKSLMGCKKTESFVQEHIHKLLYKIFEGDEGILIEVKYKNEIKHYKPEQISAMILEKLKKRAEQYLASKVENAIITVPAYFNARQREATRNAGIIAGLNVIKLISEPTAAAIGFSQGKRYINNTNIFVFDFGGGTFDASILSAQRGNFSVISAGGDTNLGGEDINSLLVEYCLSEFQKEHKINPSMNLLTMCRLKSACESAKRTLSTSPKAQIDIPFIYKDKDLFLTITRPKFEDICRGIFNKTITISRKVLDDAEMKPANIDEILLIGGSTRIPKIRSMVQRMFGKEANGAVNPDEAVAIGAAIHAANYQDDEHFKLSDVLPLSIGTGVKGGKTFRNIVKNTQIPARVTQNFTTREDNQTRLCFKIYEGDRIFSKNNTLLGSFTIEGLPPDRRGKMGADVTTEIDESGIIRVNAVATNGLKGSISISDNSNFGLTEKEIVRMREEVEKFRSDEENENKRIKAMLHLEDYVYELRDLAESRKYSERSSEILMNLFSSTLEWIETNRNVDEKTYNEIINTLKASKNQLD